MNSWHTKVRVKQGQGGAAGLGAELPKGMEYGLRTIFVGKFCGT